MIFRKGELFCGPGGFSLGANMAEFEHNGEVYKVEHSWANDFNEASCQTYRYNICPDRPRTVMLGDVRELDITKLEHIDAFAFDISSNDLTIMGEENGLYGMPKPLYKYGIKVLQQHQPKWFVAEIIEGIELVDRSEGYINILRDMNNSGYTLTPHLYKFEEYGVPQARHRIIIVGIRKDLGWQFKVPKAPFNDYKDQKTTRQALENPSIPENALNHEISPHSSKVIEMLSYIPPGGNASFDGIPEHLRLNVKGMRLNGMYKRIDPDFPAYSVTGTGGGGTQMYHYRENRALTNRERARLQTFPDWYNFFGSKERVRSQIGISFPPLGAKVIVEAILKSFAGVEYETEQTKLGNKNCEFYLADERKIEDQM